MGTFFLIKKSEIHTAKRTTLANGAGHRNANRSTIASCPPKKEPTKKIKDLNIKPETLV